MKSVGKQLQAARLAKNWTPELAARETKIKVDRLRDLEADDYSHFTSPAYARGFVRTYARFLGLDEYAILRQLDNKLPDDDTPNLVTDSNVGYLPETSMPPRVAHRDYTGLYVLLTLGCAVVLIFAFVLFQAYRVGELPRYFASTGTEAVDTGASTNAATTDSAARALPVDPNAPAPDVTSADTAASTNAAPKALPVDPSALAADTNAAPNSDAPIKAVRALPVNPSELTNATAATVPAPTVVTVTSAQELVGADTKTPPRALPVDLNAPDAPAAAPVTPPAPATQTITIPSSSARQSNSGRVTVTVPAPPAAPAATPTGTLTPTTGSAEKRLVLTASQDSFVRVTSQDSSDADKPLYASVLHSGQSIGFDGRKFSINVGVPSAVDIKLDGVNYGPHSDQESPETFTVESHLP
jgi:cytoskeleton protein RodZ